MEKENLLIKEEQRLVQTSKTHKSKERNYGDCMKIDAKYLLQNIFHPPNFMTIPF